MGVDEDPETSDGDTASESSEESTVAEPIFYHFKIIFDQTWDYTAICAKIFVKEKPYLCVKEHPLTNAHVHFQGYSKLSLPAMRNRLKRLAAKHHLRKENPKCRPTSMSCRPVDVTGFQYMCKELKSKPIASNMFSESDLTALKEKSTMHVEHLKTCVRTIIKEFTFSPIQVKTMNDLEPQALIWKITEFVLEHCERNRIALPDYNPRHTRTSIIRGLLDRPDVSRKLKAKLYSL